MTQSQKSRHVQCYTQDDIDRSERDFREFAGLSLAGWYFWDETEAYAHGPFGTEDEAISALNVYAEQLNSTP